MGFLLQFRVKGSSPSWWSGGYVEYPPSNWESPGASLRTFLSLVSKDGLKATPPVDPHRQLLNSHNKRRTLGCIWSLNSNGFENWQQICWTLSENILLFHKFSKPNNNLNIKVTIGKKLNTSTERTVFLNLTTPPLTKLSH